MAYCKSRSIAASGANVDGNRVWNEMTSRTEAKQRADITDPLPLGVAVSDAEGTILYVNQVMAEMHGYSARELVGQNFRVLVSPDDTESLTARMRERTSWRREGVNVRQDESTFPAYLVCDVIEGADAAALVITCEDITEGRPGGRISHQGPAGESPIAAVHDSLTGLPNRAMLMDLVDRSLSRAMRHKDYLFAVLVLNLDRFHVVNDSLGHTVGDQLLVAIAERLRPCFRSVDVLARLSGDEFGILLDDISDISDAVRVANRMEQHLSGAFQVGDEQVFSSGRVGIALSSSGYERSAELLRDAMLALRRVKQQPQATYAVFDLGMHERAKARLQLETDLRWAVEREEFRTVYQPILSIASGRIIGVEALVRWEHPSRGMLRPVDFLSVAEETGAIVPLGWWVLRQGCEQMRQWQQQFPTSPPLTLSVNLSGKQIMRRDVVREIDKILRETNFDPRDLRLEMTETVVMDDAESTLKILQELKQLDVKLDVDDFGIGYSSFRYLHRFPIDTLKIDRSFVGSIDTRRESAEIVRTILALAKNIGVSVVAEGVETAEQLAMLKDMECEYAQGYYFSEPVEHERATELIGKSYNDG